MLKNLAKRYHRLTYRVKSKLETVRQSKFWGFGVWLALIPYLHILLLYIDKDSLITTPMNILIESMTACTKKTTMEKINNKIFQIFII